MPATIEELFEESRSGNNEDPDTDREAKAELLEVNNPVTEAQVCKALAQVEDALRILEEERTSITKPQRAAIDIVNAKAKVAAAPLEAQKQALQAVLEAYRLQPAVQTIIAERLSAERKFRAAEKEGDMLALTALSQTIADLREQVPPSVDAGPGFEVRFRFGIEIQSVDEALIPEHYYKRVLDEKAVKNDIDALGSVPGVTHRWTYTPAVYAKKTT